jgi:phosphoribosylaminoimidazole-succinocarboxamide synthase
MDVLPAKVFGKGIEFVCRLKADGSFVKRYGTYASFGDDLDYLVEVTLKDDERKDPPITKDTLVALGILTSEEFESCADLTRQTAKIIAADLKEKGMQLYDLKFEFGKHGGDVILMDEISAGCMRVYKDDKIVAPMDLGRLVLG